MIRAVIFDCFGVLATTGTWHRFLDSLPPDIDTDPVHALNHSYDAGHITRDEFMYRIRDLTGHTPEEIESIIDTDNLKNEPLISYIRDELKPSYKIGLLSNIASDWVTSTFLNKDEQVLFDDMVFSYQVGMTKPNKEIFKLACERLDVQLEETVFIDDIDSYVKAAEALGMHGITYPGSVTLLRQELDPLLAT